MPVDPNISLGVSVAQPSSILSGNPLTSLEGFADVQNKLNTNKLFQQTFSAKQKAGEIIASSPDLDTAAQRMQQDPEVAPFAGEILNNYRQLELTNQQILGQKTTIQGQLQDQAKHGYDTVLQGLPAVLDNPSEATWEGAINSRLKLLPKPIRDLVAPVIGDYKKSLLDGIPTNPDGTFTDPAAASAEVKKRAFAGGLSVGITPDTLRGVTGTSATRNTGDQILSGVEAPPQAGGGFTSSGNPLAVGTPPSYGDIGGGTVGARPALPGNALGAQSAPQPQQPTQAGPQAAGQVTQDAVPTPPSGKLFPLSNMVSPTTGAKGLSGINVLSPVQQKAALDLQDKFSGDDLRAFNNANATQGLLVEMDRDFDTMARGGGFLVPGAAARFRTDIARFANTLSQMTNSKEAPFPADKISAIENFSKDTNRLGFTYVTTALGAQREAAQTINKAIEAVPGMDNTYLGGKLLIGSIHAATQRVIDQRNFENIWQQKNQGNLTGAAEAFNKAFPAEDYAKQVMDKFGLSQKGFTSPDAVAQAVKQGYLTKQQATDILYSQFPDQFKK